MPTSIRITEETRSRLEHRKREDESFDELLERLLRETEPVEIDAWDSGMARRARDAIDRSRGSFGR